MTFYRCVDWRPGAEQLAARLQSELQAGKTVLWLLSGGSNVAVAVNIAARFELSQTRNLHLMLADERYGDVGHPDSNWAQLIEAGFNPQAATVRGVLVGLSFEQTVEHYRQQAAEAFAAADVVVAQLGIGDDGHTAGILPNSPAAEPSEALVIGYERHPYRRLTLSFAALRQITTAYVFAFGGTKRPALEQLEHAKLPLAEQPAQILRELPQANIYNDQVGENI